MGHPASDERLEFVNLGVDCGNNRTWHVCKHCDQVYKDSKQPDGTYSLPEPKKIKGRIENFKSHLKRCSAYTAYVQANTTSNTILNYPSSSNAVEMLTQTSVSNSSQHTSVKRQRTIDEFYSGISQADEMKLLERYILEFQADSNLPDSFIERPSIARLLRHANKMSGGIDPLPKRKTLGGPILDEYAKACENHESLALSRCQDKTGGRVNFLSDVWMNIARAHLLGCQLALFGIVLAYGLFPTGSRHDGVAIAEQMEQVMIKMQQEGWKIGAVVTDNAGQCGRILSLRWPEIAFVICFAHDLNNLVKAILKSDYAEVTKKASDAVSALNASSAKWLVEADACMRETYGYSLKVKQLCETRWNSMHGCFASLLRIRSALELLEVKFRDVADFPSVLRVFGEQTFWDSLEDAENVVRPLAYASLKLQRDENTMADVVVCYLDIFTGFSKNQYGSQNLVREVEKRWQQCEQPLMLLALFLHPAHRQAAKAILDKTPLTSVCSLCRIGMYYFKRFNIGKDMVGLYEDLHNWIMNDDVTGLSFAEFSSIDAYWNCMRSEMPRSKLPDFALVVLSIAVNTATCERYFSELALIHTAKRNRMSPDKARKLALVRKKVREYDAGQDDAKSSKTTRLIDPTERTRLRYRDDRFECLEPEVDAEDGIVVGPDTAFEYWQAVLCELEDDDDPPITLDNTASADNTGSPLTTEAASLAEEKRFAAVLETIKIQSTDPIPEGDRRSFPRHNDRLFPQEQRFPGLRGQKVTLAELSKTPNTPSAQPVWHFASPQPFRRHR